MQCKESKWSYYGAVAFVCCVFIFLSAFFFRFLKGWKTQNARVVLHSHKVYVRMAAAFVASLLRNVVFIGALTETRRVSHSWPVRVLLFSAMVCHMFVWLCCFNIWVTRLQQAFANSVYRVPRRLLQVYNISAVSVALVLFTSSSVHFATDNTPLEQVLLEVVTAVSFVAMFTLQTHLCSNFGSRLIELVAVTSKRRLQRSHSEAMTATPNASMATMSQISTATATQNTSDRRGDDSAFCRESEMTEITVETTDARSKAQSQIRASQILATMSISQPRTRRKLKDFEDSERKLLRVATKQSVVIASAILCELLAMAGFLVLSEAGPNSLCVTPLNLCAFIALVAGVNGVVFCVYLSFSHSRAEYNALCFKCDTGCGKLATYFVDKYSEERSPVVVQSSELL